MMYSVVSHQSWWWRDLDIDAIAKIRHCANQRLVPGTDKIYKTGWTHNRRLPVVESLLRNFTPTPLFMHAMILTVPPHWHQTETSILKTRFSLSAQVSGLWPLANDFSLLVEEVFLELPLPRFAGVTLMRCLMLCVSTPWKRVRLILGLGTIAANLEMKSKGSKITCVVSSR